MTAFTPTPIDPDASQTLVHLQSGGEEQLTELFMRLRAHLRRMIEVRLDRRLHARVDASDIVQETFVRASRNLDAYLKSPTMHPVVWLRLIGKRVIAETHRKHFRERRTPSRELHLNDTADDSLVLQIADSLHSAGSQVVRRELIEQVRATVARLQESDREILEMRHMEALTLEEAANVLELSYDTAKKRYQRALKRFRKLSEADWSADES